MSQELVTVVHIQPGTDGSQSLVKQISAAGSEMELCEVSSVAEATQVVQQFLPCILLLPLTGEGNGEPEHQLLKTMEKSVQSGMLKVLVLSAIKNHPIKLKFAEVGIKEIVEEPVPAKALQFKLNFAYKAVLAARKRAALAAAGDMRISKAGDAAVNTDAKRNVVKSKYKPALQLAEDTFVFKTGSAKKAGKRIVLQMEGPDPETGRWVRDGKEATAPRWRWEPKQKPADQEAEDGWIHEGDEPEYDEKTQSWQLRSEKPALYFRRKGKRVAAKVESEEDGTVSVAEDSPLAEENLTKNRLAAANARAAKRIASEAEEEDPVTRKLKSKKVKENGEEDSPLGAGEAEKEAAKLLETESAEEAEKAKRRKSRPDREKDEAAEAEQAAAATEEAPKVEEPVALLADLAGAFAKIAADEALIEQGEDPNAPAASSEEEAKKARQKSRPQKKRATGEKEDALADPTAADVEISDAVDGAEEIAEEEENLTEEEEAELVAKGIRQKRKNGRKKKKANGEEEDGLGAEAGAENEDELSEEEESEGEDKPDLSLEEEATAKRELGSPETEEEIAEQRALKRARAKKKGDSADEESSNEEGSAKADGATFAGDSAQGSDLALDDSPEAAEAKKRAKQKERVAKERAFRAIDSLEEGGADLLWGNVTRNAAKKKKKEDLAAAKKKEEEGIAGAPGEANGEAEAKSGRRKRKRAGGTDEVSEEGEGAQSLLEAESGEEDSSADTQFAEADGDELSAEAKRRKAEEESNAAAGEKSGQLGDAADASDAASAEKMGQIGGEAKADGADLLGQRGSAAAEAKDESAEKGAMGPASEDAAAESAVLPFAEEVAEGKALRLTLPELLALVDLSDLFQSKEKIDRQKRVLEVVSQVIRSGELRWQQNELTGLELAERDQALLKLFNRSVRNLVSIQDLEKGAEAAKAA